MKLNFDKLTIGTLRKYQYRFKLHLKPQDKPLVSRLDLIAAIEAHFENELPNEPEATVVGLFLRLKKEERADQ